MNGSKNRKWIKISIYRLAITQQEEKHIISKNYIYIYIQNIQIKNILIKNYYHENCIMFISHIIYDNCNTR